MLREDSERQTKNDQMILQLMQSMIVSNNQAGSSVFQQTTHSQYPVSVVMNSDFTKEHPSYPETPAFHQQRYRTLTFPKYNRAYPTNGHHDHSFPADLRGPHI